MTTDEREVTEKEEGVKGYPQVRALFFLPSEFSQLLILCKTILEMEGMEFGGIRCFCLPRLLTAKGEVLHERIINRQRAERDPAILLPGVLTLLIWNKSSALLGAMFNPQ